MVKHGIVAFVMAVFLFISPSVFAKYSKDDFDIDYELDEVCEGLYDICRYVYRYSVIPAVDGLIVRSVEVNDGNCKATTHYFNQRLGRDDYAEFLTTTDERGRRCAPRTLYIDTNRGDWTYDF